MAPALMADDGKSHLTGRALSLACNRRAVISPQEDRDVMVACLQLGAADYMIKPLRLNELRNLWARVYWWRRVSRRSCP